VTLVGARPAARAPSAVVTMARGLPVVIADPAGGVANVCLAGADADPATLAAVLRHSRGLVAVALPIARLRALGLDGPRLRADGRDPFWAPVDAVGVGARPGSTAGLARTVQVLAEPLSPAVALRPSGHVFPMPASDDGLRARLGRPEAAVALALRAGRTPAAVLAAFATPAGNYLRGAAAARQASALGLPFLTPSDVARDAP
jgi:3,4-dihydroxy-2-butanone 4-phosphate synthase